MRRPFKRTSVDWTLVETLAVVHSDELPQHQEVINIQAFCIKMFDITARNQGFGSGS